MENKKDLHIMVAGEWASSGHVQCFLLTFIALPTVSQWVRSKSVSAYWLVCEDLNHEVHKTKAKAKQNKLTVGDVKKEMSMSWSWELNYLRRDRIIIRRRMPWSDKINGETLRQNLLIYFTSERFPNKSGTRAFDRWIDTSFLYQNIKTIKRKSTSQR